MISELWIPIKFSFVEVIKSGGHVFLVLHLVDKHVLIFSSIKIKRTDQTRFQNTLRTNTRPNLSCLHLRKLACQWFLNFGSLSNFHLWCRSNLTDISFWCCIKLHKSVLILPNIKIKRTDQTLCQNTLRINTRPNLSFLHHHKLACQWFRNFGSLSNFHLRCSWSNLAEISFWCSSQLHISDLICSSIKIKITNQTLYKNTVRTKKRPNLNFLHHHKLAWQWFLNFGSLSNFHLWCWSNLTDISWCSSYSYVPPNHRFWVRTFTNGKICWTLTHPVISTKEKYGSDITNENYSNFAPQMKKFFLLHGTLTQPVI